MTKAPPEPAGEFDLIARYFRPLAVAPGARGLMDDAAVLPPAPAGYETAVTADTVTEGVHFLPRTRAADVARKALRVNLSDLAAMGAEPAGYTLALALPAGRGEDWIADFAEGLRADQELFNLSLLGGDTTMTPGPLSVTINAFGFAPEGAAVGRNGARPGDILAVTGTIGDAALGLDAETGKLAALAPEHAAHLRARYLRPEPRLGLLAALGEYAHAAIDVSDGLAADAAHIAGASGLRTVIDAAAAPLSPAARAALEAEPGLMTRILTGGDDYELLIALAPDALERAAAWSAETGAALTPAGRCEAGEGAVILDADGAPLTLPRPGFRHF
ncbi:MAG: thiamine-phosphate kinase [Rhodospirillales bacterium]